MGVIKLTPALRRYLEALRDGRDEEIRKAVTPIRRRAITLGCVTWVDSERVLTELGHVALVVGHVQMPFRKPVT